MPKAVGAVTAALGPQHGVFQPQSPAAVQIPDAPLGAGGQSDGPEHLARHALVPPGGDAQPQPLGGAPGQTVLPTQSASLVQAPDVVVAVRQVPSVWQASWAPQENPF